MAIRIVNLKTYRPVAGEVLIKVDRSSKLGNPFFMSDESERDEVCDDYYDYFWRNVAKSPEFFKEVNQIVKQARVQDVALGCWCYPKRCHAEVIKSFVEDAL